MSLVIPFTKNKSCLNVSELSNTTCFKDKEYLLSEDLVLRLPVWFGLVKMIKSVLMVWLWVAFHLNYINIYYYSSNCNHGPVAEVVNIYIYIYIYIYVYIYK